MTASPTSSAADASLAAQSPKVSCLECRAVKRKCNSPNVDTRCRRCVINNLQCQYKRHQRGRPRTTQPLIPDAAPPSIDSVIENHSEARRTPTIPPAQILDSIIIDPRLLASPERARQPGPEPPAAAPPDSAYHDLPHARTDTFGEPAAVNTAESHYFVPDKDRPPIGADPVSLTALELQLRLECPDPVGAGLLTENEGRILLDSYFDKFNSMLPILDPNLHTISYCRSRSPLLFTAIMTAITQTDRPSVRSSCLHLCSKLLAQAIQHGLRSVEIVQAILLLGFWKRAEDSSSWRLLGYAIRMAQEMKIDRISKHRGLEGASRIRMLNNERTWLNLVVADYHAAIHYSLPRLIARDGIDDPQYWLDGHLPSPGEVMLGPLITWSRMCRLYADLVSSMSGIPSDLRLLDWLEAEYHRWSDRWLNTSDNNSFNTFQLSTLRVCNAFFRFHLSEYRLVRAIRYRKDLPIGAQTEYTPPSSLMFYQCAEAALGVSTVFRSDFADPATAIYAFYLVWIALSVTSIWLVKNMTHMSEIDRLRICEVLEQTARLIRAASHSKEDMAGYTARLLSDLLATIPSSWRNPPQSDNQIAIETRSSVLGVASTSLTRTHVAPELLNGEGTSSSVPMDAFTDPANITNEPLPLLDWQSFIRSRRGSPHPDDTFADQTIGGSGRTSLPNDYLSAPDIATVPAYFEELLLPSAEDHFWRSLFQPSAGDVTDLW